MEKEDIRHAICPGKPKYQVRDRRLSEAEYRVLGGILREALESDHYRIHADILRLIALTGCRHGESSISNGARSIFREAVCGWSTARRAHRFVQLAYLSSNI